MNKTLIISMLATTLLFSGCDKFKTKKDDTATTASEWSCTSESNLKDLQNFLKQEYLKKIDKRLRETSYYHSDQALLKKINDSLKFEIKGIRTLTPDTNKTNELECEGQIVVNFPKGLLKRAENAYLEAEVERECDECESSYSTLMDYLDGREVPLTVQDDYLKGKFGFNVIKTDKEGYSLSTRQQDDVINAVVIITQKAVQYEAYVKENSSIKEEQTQNTLKNAEQVELAQKAMDIRKKELNEEKSKVVERLNQTWDRFSDEQKAELQQDQSEWFEKRDIDCKVIAQKPAYNLSDSERETYQKQYNYWDDAMQQQNVDMQYTKCFNQRTNERIVYLNNVF
ncbi:DUF1311 domain-containing protein [Acinetobacter shaoyimingii]|uniref:DUF1311 domain-containing protein n=1 Tax=Acinetobacter shaoyimingii TaxID=2715164 RepID=A0A6G8RWI4_9GAMM|nr:DUF1311 domain-containing protein [Acinetobacter shaoyimingii]QIO06306.1 DUF1311 domain-containing protein [Acinetobacter shaoyimingii]